MRDIEIQIGYSGSNQFNKEEPCPCGERVCSSFSCCFL